MFSCSTRSPPPPAGAKASAIEGAEEIEHGHAGKSDQEWARTHGKTDAGKKED
jgi:hypothetical protein